MSHTNLKLLLGAAWIVAIGAISALVGIGSMAGGALMTAIAVVPPLVAYHFWTPPAASLSEEIQKALH